MVMEAVTEGDPIVNGRKLKTFTTTTKESKHLSFRLEEINYLLKNGAPSVISFFIRIIS